MTCTLKSWRLVRWLSSAAAVAALSYCSVVALADEPAPSADSLVALQPGDDGPRPRPDRDRDREREGDRRPEERGPRDRGPREQSPEARERGDRRPEDRGPEARGDRSSGGGRGGSFGSSSFEFRGPMGGFGPGMRGPGAPGGIDARLNQLESKLDEVLREVRELRRQGPPRPPMGMSGARGGGGRGGFGMSGGPPSFGRMPGGDIGPQRGRGGVGPGPRREAPPRERDDDRDDDRPRDRGRQSADDNLSF